MGFDPDDDLAGPFLDEFHKQSPYAGELLDIFVELINEYPDFLEAMHRHYREVRTKVEGKRYRGKAFPKPGTFELYVNEPPELPSGFMDIMKAIGAADAFTSPKVGKTKDRARSAITIRSLADRYYSTYSKPDIAIHQFLQDELRAYILEHDTFALEICSLLVELCDGEVDEDRIDAALRLLSDMLDILRVELERGRPVSKERMARLQNTLAQKIYVECGDSSLCAAVSHLLLSSRVELLPVLHNANDQRLLLDAHHNGLRDTPPEEVMAGVFRGIEEMGVGSPFEAQENMLQILALGNPEMQTALCEKMLGAESTLVRDTASLMLLHPMPDVRLGVSRLLAADSSNVTPETLRRLIITRNWFPEEIRKNIDQAVNNAPALASNVLRCLTVPLPPFMHHRLTVPLPSLS